MKWLAYVLLSFVIFYVWYIYIASGVWKIVIYRELLSFSLFLSRRSWVTPKLLAWYLHNVIVRYLSCVSINKETK
jgi:hypothetical protein